MGTAEFICFFLYWRHLYYYCQGKAFLYTKVLCSLDRRTLGAQNQSEPADKNLKSRFIFDYKQYNLYNGLIIISRTN